MCGLDLVVLLPVWWWFNVGDVSESEFSAHLGGNGLRQMSNLVVDVV